MSYGKKQQHFIRMHFTRKRDMKAGTKRKPVVHKYYVPLLTLESAAIKVLGWGPGTIVNQTADVKGDRLIISRIPGA